MITLAVQLSAVRVTMVPCRSPRLSSKNPEAPGVGSSARVSDLCRTARVEPTAKILQLTERVCFRPEIKHIAKAAFGNEATSLKLDTCDVSSETDENGIAVAFLWLGRNTYAPGEDVGWHGSAPSPGARSCGRGTEGSEGARAFGCKSPLDKGPKDRQDNGSAEGAEALDCPQRRPEDDSGPDETA